jgi:Amt family ammonium transporter
MAMEDVALNSGNTAWLLTSAALVLVMIPGLAIFYGGMTRSKGVLNMLMMVMGALGLVGIIWVIYGYSMAYGDSVAGGLFGSPSTYFGLEGLMADDPAAEFPAMADVAFQLGFAAITAGLIAGAIADRAKFGAWLLFAGIWVTLVYFPVAHWVWGGGWIGEGGFILNGTGAIDFAGGTAVHINAGAAALALALVLGRRLGWPKTPMRPHNLTLVMLGAGLLWFGWFGFNAGSAYAADNTAAVVFLNTIVATCAAMLGWLLTEKIRDGHATSLGAASGIVAGLVAITPACSSVSPTGAIIIGAIAGVLCALAVGLKYAWKYDDSLDVVGVHLVGGLVGTILIGVFATADAPAGVDGLVFGGGAAQLWSQTASAVAVMIYSFVIAFIVAKLIDLTIGFRVDEDTEIGGIDRIEHAESAYEFSENTGAGGSFAGVGSAAARAAANKEGASA